MRKHVAFDFDAESLAVLKQMTEDFGFGSIAEVIRHSVGINRALLDQKAQGYSEVAVRNPKTGQERVMGTKE